MAVFMKISGVDGPTRRAGDNPAGSTAWIALLALSRSDGQFSVSKHTDSASGKIQSLMTRRERVPRIIIEIVSAKTGATQLSVSARGCLFSPYISSGGESENLTFTFESLTNTYKGDTPGKLSTLAGQIDSLMEEEGIFYF